MNIPRGQLLRTPIRAADMADDLYDEHEYDDDLDSVLGGENLNQMSELDWSDSFDDFDSQDWDDYNGSAEYNDDDE